MDRRHLHRHAAISSLRRGDSNLWLSEHEAVDPVCCAELATCSNRCSVASFLEVATGCLEASDEGDYPPGAIGLHRTDCDVTTTHS